MERITINKYWSKAFDLPIGYGIKIYFTNTPFKIKLKDYSNPIRDQEFTVNIENKSPYVISAFDSSTELEAMANPTIAFKTINTEEFVVEVELWQPG